MRCGHLFNGIGGFAIAELGEMLPERFYTIRVTDKHDAHLTRRKRM